MSDKNHAASIRARLLNRAKHDGVDFQRKLVRYAIERLLYRARLKVQVDIGLGDAVVPEPQDIDLASLLDLPAHTSRRTAGTIAPHDEAIRATFAS